MLTLVVVTAVGVLMLIGSALSMSELGHSAWEKSSTQTTTPAVTTEVVSPASEPAVVPATEPVTAPVVAPTGAYATPQPALP